MTDQPPKTEQSFPPPQKPLTPAEQEAARVARNKRNIAIALGLVGFIDPPLEEAIAAVS